MHVATKRSLIAATAITAAGLFGSLPYEGASVAQQGAPTVHQEVALVDFNDAQQVLVGVEDALNTTLSSATVGDNGVLDVLYTGLGNDLSEALLYSDGPGGIYGTVATDNEYLDVFNGAAAAGYNGFISNTLAFQAQLNDILGLPEADSQAFLLDQFNDLFVGAVPASLGDPVPGDGFVADLVSIANNQYDLAGNNLVDYTEYLFTNFNDVLGGLAGVDLGDLLGNLTDSLTTLTSGLTDNVNDLVNAIIGLL